MAAEPSPAASGGAGALEAEQRGGRSGAGGGSSRPQASVRASGASAPLWVPRSGAAGLGPPAPRRRGPGAAAATQLSLGLVSSKPSALSLPPSTLAAEPAATGRSSGQVGRRCLFLSSEQGSGRPGPQQCEVLLAYANPAGPPPSGICAWAAAGGVPAHERLPGVPARGGRQPRQRVHQLPPGAKAPKAGAGRLANRAGARRRAARR